MGGERVGIWCKKDQSKGAEPRSSPPQNFVDDLESDLTALSAEKDRGLVPGNGVVFADSLGSKQVRVIAASRSGGGGKAKTGILASTGQDVGTIERFTKEAP